MHLLYGVDYTIGLYKHLLYGMDYAIGLWIWLN